MNTKKLITTLSIATATLVGPSATHADDIYRAMRGPTNQQIDLQTNYSWNTINQRTAQDQAIIKYWTGDELGFFELLSLPFKQTKTENTSATGPGDITLTMGPRGRIGTNQFMLYGATTLPSGNQNTKPALGTGRYDFKLGTAVTALTKDSTLEADGVVERTWTEMGTIHPAPNETYAAVLTGGAFSSWGRAIAGFLGSVNDKGQAYLTARGIIRYTPSKSTHVELVLDVPINAKEKPKTTAIGVRFRLNVP